MFSQESGAEIQARSSKPSIDLATLIELVAKAIPTSNNTGEPNIRPLAKVKFKLDLCLAQAHNYK